MTLDIDSLREGWDFEAKLAIGKYGRGQLPKSQHKDPSSQHKDPSSQHKETKAPNIKKQAPNREKLTQDRPTSQL